MVRLRILTVLIPTFSSLLLFPGCVEKEVEVTETYWETEYRMGTRTEPYTEFVEQRRVTLTPVRVFEAPLYVRGVEYGKQLWGWYYQGFEVDTSGYPRSEIVVRLTSEPEPWVVSVVDLTGVGQISDPPATSYFEWRTVKSGVTVGTAPFPFPFQKWLDDFNAITTDPKRVKAFVRSDIYDKREIVIDATDTKEFAVMISSSVSYWTSSPGVVDKVELVLYGTVTKEKRVSYLEPYQVEKQRVVKQVKKVPFWEAIFGK